MSVRKHEKIKEEVDRYVESHLHEKCSIHELAHHIGYSVKQLNRIIKETTDQSLSDDIKRFHFLEWGRYKKIIGGFV